jgi:hypothetical protein
MRRALCRNPIFTTTAAKGEMLMENRKRNVQLIIRVTEEERRLIAVKMKQVPAMNLSAFARKMLIDGYVINLDFSEIKAHADQLGNISANINQIAKRINMTGNVYGEDIAEIKQHMDEVWEMERKLMYSIMHYAK